MPKEKIIYNYLKNIMINDTDTSFEHYLINKNDETIILVRSIFCSISFFCCFLLIIVYIILFLQVKLKLCTREEEDNDDLSPFIESEFSSDESKRKKINNDGKIGLGSNFMFILTISNFFGSLFEFLFFFYYKNKIKNVKLTDKNENIILYDSFNDDIKCHLFGFAHNFFDLYTVCWISMLTLLFYRSTNLSNEMQYQDKKYLIIGFIYSSVLSLIFFFFFFITESYGFATYYCSFRYKEIKKVNGRELKFFNEKTLSKFWRISFVVVTFLNNAFNAICLIKATLFYSKKLEMIKKQNKNEYKLMRIYVWVFRIFPIVLLTSRIFKGLSRIIIDEFNPPRKVEDSIEYANAFFFASNGIFDSIACIFFFKGVFWCCWPDTFSRNISNDKGSDMEYLGSDIIDD